MDSMDFYGFDWLQWNSMDSMDFYGFYGLIIIIIIIINDDYYYYQMLFIKMSRKLLAEHSHS